MFNIIGISISVFLGFLLLIKKDKSRADRILAVWLLLLFVNQLLHYLTYSKELYQYPFLLGIEFPIPVLHGILLYFYALEVTGRKQDNIWKNLLHLIPALSLVILAIPFYSLSGEEKIYVFENNAEGYEWYVIYENALIALSGLIYSALTLALIKRHRINIQNNFSNTDKKELQWLQYLSIGMGIIWILSIFFDSTIIFSAVVVFVLFIGFFGINQLDIFNTNQTTKLITIDPDQFDKKDLDLHLPLNAAKKRYAKSGLNEQMAEQLYSDLIQKMSEELIFKENDLTSTELARRLNIHPNYLSQVINEKEQKNFYNYINSLRIKEFIKLASLPESNKYTLLSLAFECGFNSKSTFNKHFKVNTGKTPTEYFKLQGSDL